MSINFNPEAANDNFKFKDGEKPAKQPINEKVAEIIFRANEDATLQVAAMVREMLDASKMTILELAEKLDMDVDYLRKITHQIVSKNETTGLWEHLVIPLDLLYRIATITGNDINISFKPKGY